MSPTWSCPSLLLLFTGKDEWRMGDFTRSSSVCFQGMARKRRCATINQIHPPWSQSFENNCTHQGGGAEQEDAENDRVGWGWKVGGKRKWWNGMELLLLVNTMGSNFICTPKNRTIVPGTTEKREEEHCNVNINNTKMMPPDRKIQQPPEGWSTHNIHSSSRPRT